MEYRTCMDLFRARASGDKTPFVRPACSAWLKPRPTKHANASRKTGRMGHPGSRERRPREGGADAPDFLSQLRPTKSGGAKAKAKAAALKRGATFKPGLWMGWESGRMSILVIPINPLKKS